MGCDVTYLKVCVWNMGSLRCLMKNKCQNRVPGHPIYKVGHNLTGFNNILEGGIVPLKVKINVVVKSNALSLHLTLLISR